MCKVVQTTGLILLSILSLAITTAATPATTSAPLGVVEVGQKALLGSVPIVNGTSLFDGDRVTTEGQGSLRIRLGAAQVWLGENSALSFHRVPGGVSAKLESGQLRFAAALGPRLEFSVLAAQIRGNQPNAAGQLAVMAPNEFQVGATSGSLTVDVDGDVRTVDESTAYDATIGNADPQMPQIAGHRSFILLWVLISLIAFGTIFAIVHAKMSPSAVH